MKDQYLIHYGIKGQKWGIRRYQNPDGTWTEEGLKRRYATNSSVNKKKQNYRNSDGSYTDAEKERYRKIMTSTNLSSKDKKFRASTQNAILNKLKKNSEDMKILHIKAKAVKAAEKHYDEVLDSEYVKVLNSFRRGEKLEDQSYKICKDLYGGSEILNSDNPALKEKYKNYDDSKEYRRMYLEDLNKVPPDKIVDFMEKHFPAGDKWNNDRQLKQAVALARFMDKDYKFDPNKDPVYVADKNWSNALNDVREAAYKVGKKAVDSVLGKDLASEKASGWINDLYPGITYSDIEIGNLLSQVSSILDKEDDFYNSLDYPNYWI